MEIKYVINKLDDVIDKLWDGTNKYLEMPLEDNNSWLMKDKLQLKGTQELVDESEGGTSSVARTTYKTYTVPTGEEWFVERIYTYAWAAGRASYWRRTTTYLQIKGIDWLSSSAYAETTSVTDSDNSYFTDNYKLLYRLVEGDTIKLDYKWEGTYEGPGNDWLSKWQVYYTKLVL